MPSPSVKTPQAEVSPAVLTPAVAVTAKPKSFTNWDALNGAKLKPVAMICQEYRGRRADFSCHTKLPFSASIIKNHISAEHGGGFKFAVRQSDSKPSKLWNEIAEAGLEAHDFRCDVCDAVVRFHPSAIIPHLKPHRGKSKQAYQEMTRNNPGAVGMFDVQFAVGGPTSEQMVEDEDEFVEAE